MKLLPHLVDGIARRCRIDLDTPAETAIRKAINAVESLPASPLLTDAVVLLGKAKDKVSDFVEGITLTTNDEPKQLRRAKDALRNIRERVEHNSRSKENLCDEITQIRDI